MNSRICYNNTEILNMHSTSAVAWNLGHLFLLSHFCSALRGALSNHLMTVDVWCAGILWSMQTIIFATGLSHVLMTASVSCSILFQLLYLLKLVPSELNDYWTLEMSVGHLLRGLWWLSVKSLCVWMWIFCYTESHIITVAVLIFQSMLKMLTYSSTPIS